MSRAWSGSAEVSAALVVKNTRAPSRETAISVAPEAPPVPADMSVVLSPLRW